MGGIDCLDIEAAVSVKLPHLVVMSCLEHDLHSRFRHPSEVQHVGRGRVHMGFNLTMDLSLPFTGLSTALLRIAHATLVSMGHCT